MARPDTNAIDISIRRVGDEYDVTVASRHAGETSDRFPVSAVDASLGDLVGISARIRSAVRELEVSEERDVEFDPSLLKAYGQRLYETVFPSKARVLFQKGLQNDQPNLIRLRLDKVPELAGLAWEYLFSTDADDFLCLSSETPIVRYLEVPQPVEPLEVRGPLKMLAVVSSPDDPRYPPLDVDREVGILRDALAGLEAIELEVLERPTLEGLQGALRRDDVHILHFVGHGDYDLRADIGVLLFDDGVASADDIKTLLRDKRSLKLVVLNACKGARSSEGDSFVGTAQMLAKAGVPAVVAMQFAITDEAAITFAKAFYGSIVDYCPVETALTEARKALSWRKDLTEWGTPVLFMRANDGQIFQPRARDVPAALAAERAEGDAGSGGAGQAGLGLGNLIRIIGRSREAKGAAMKFRLLFETACNESVSLEYYKNLHDQLHNLRISCFDFMTRVIRRASYSTGDPMANELDVETLEDQCQLVLGDTIFELRNLAERSGVSAYNASWIDELSEAEVTLDAAIANRDMRALKRAESLIGRVLNRRSYELNTLLKVSADSLNLPGLLAALNELVELIRPLASSQIDPQDILQFSDAVEKLTFLQARLAELLSLHDEWQNVDQAIHELMASLVSDPEDEDQIAYSVSDWALSKSRVKSLYDGYAESRELNKYELRIDDAFGKLKMADVKRYLGNYRRGVNLCFFRVDRDLQEQCKELRPIVAPLAGVLEYLT